jgi:acyl-CoA dehydrogenase
MSEQLNIITASVERLFSNSRISDLQMQLDSGKLPEALWHELESSGFSHAEMWKTAIHILRIAARFPISIPLAETILAANLLKDSGLVVPSGVLSFVAKDCQKNIAISSCGKVSGEAELVPWARHAEFILVIVQDKLAVVKKKYCNVRLRSNIAGEPRDNVTFNNVNAIEIIEGISASGVFNQAALLRSAQIVGTLDTVLNITIQYVSERQQFGRPISKFQAIQHHMAELAGYVASASAALVAAAENPSFISIASSKVISSEAATRSAAIAHQAFGAIGFTAEHFLHRYSKALWAWRDEYGDEAYWNKELGSFFAKKGSDMIWPNIVGAVK